jgi:TPR repeat protein
VLGGVFICYRREDSAGFARLIYDRLAQRLQRDNVFFDVDNIEPGVDFFEILSERVGKCDALVAVIGKSWISAADKDNRRRLDDPDDFVRIEIEAALERGVRVIPVLIDGAAMPRASDLPDSLKKLVRRQYVEVSHSRFDSDVERLTRTLSSILENLRQRDAAQAESATRADEERRAREAAQTERVAREAAKKAEAAERARQSAEAEASKRADKDRPAREVAEAEEVRREKLAADRGEAWGQANLGVSYRDGRGGLPKYDREAARLFKLAADQGNAAGQANLGFFYENGRGGLPKDDREAARLYKLSADQGSATGQANLGVFNEYGLGGLPKDDREAARLYKLAADQGRATAQVNLGRFCEYGRGASRGACAICRGASSPSPQRAPSVSPPAIRAFRSRSVIPPGTSMSPRSGKPRTISSPSAISCPRTRSY